MGVLTDRPYQKHAEISGLEFMSLLGDVRPTETKRHSNKSRNAVFSWIEGEQTRGQAGGCCWRKN